MTGPFAEFNRPLHHFEQDKEGRQRALPGLRAHGHGRMATDNRRPEHPICDNTNEQQGRNHDGRNQVFHGLFLIREAARRRVSRRTYNLPKSMAAARVRPTSNIMACRYFLPPVLAGSRSGEAACSCIGRSPANRRATAASSNRGDRPTDNRAIIGASASAARTFGKAASLAASSQGSTPSRVNAEITLSGIPFGSSPTAAKRKSFRSEWSRANRADSVTIVHPPSQDARPLRIVSHPQRCRI